MKTQHFFTVMALAAGFAIYAQPTSYGNLNEGNAGDGGGTNNSYFGYLAGLVNTGTSNTFIGYRSGHDNTTGISNTFVGSEAGFNNTTANSNTFIGATTGVLNTTGSSNTFVGNGSGYNNSTGNSNTFIGATTGALNTTGYHNIFIGSGSGYNNSTGYSNTFVGGQAGQNNTTGNYNVFMGDYSGHDNTTGNYNVFIGHDSGQDITTGSNNTFLGRRSGFTNQTGSGNVFLGYQAGYNETGSNLLYIDNSSTASPLIWGNFNTNILNFNGSVGINDATPSATLDVNGTVKIGNVTTPAGYNLYVDNGILTEKVRIAVAGGINWADYVFEPDYRLKPLAEVEAFVKINKHLPNVPSAAQVEKEGIDLAQMDAKLLEKIEELMLYVIELNKKVARLEAENRKLTTAGNLKE